MAKNFKDLSEQEILALAIRPRKRMRAFTQTSPRELKADYPATAQIFKEMEAEENEHRRELIEEYRRRFGKHIPLIRREDVKGSRAPQTGVDDPVPGISLKREHWLAPT